ncbi:MAG: hypothetical protein AB1668_03140 [Nanoarchaeota archaeon]
MKSTLYYTKYYTKLTVGLVFIAIVLVLLSGFAAASLEIDSADLTIPVNYKNLEDDDDELSVSHTITIKNKGNSSENITLALENLLPNYGLSVSPGSLTLEASGNSGDSKEITISGKIPVDEDQGARDIGTLKIKGASEGERSFTLKTEVKSMLELKRINVYVNGNKEKSVDEDDDEVKDLHAGEEIELKFVLDNLFDSDYDQGTIEGDITIALDDDDFGDEIDDEVSFDIDAGDISDEEATFKFTIPDDAEDDDYTLGIYVEGKDENKAKYTTDWELILKVEREDDDLQIEKISLSPEEVSCSRQSLLTVEVVNRGSNMQRHAALSIVNNQLGILMDYQFELERGASDDNSIIKQLSLNIGNDIKPGTYPLTATVYYDYDVTSDKKVANLKVKECAASAKTESAAEKNQSAKKTEAVKGEVAANGNTQNAGQNAGETTQISSSKIVKSVENPYTKDDYLIALLIVAIVVVLVLIVLFLLALLS